jgi:hypothetical protein
MDNENTKTCAKCFRCRIVFAKPRTDMTEITSKSAVRRIYCSEGHFPYDFVSITEFNVSSVRRRAESCPDYDASESAPHVIERQPEVFVERVYIEE